MTVSRRDKSLVDSCREKGNTNTPGLLCLTQQVRYGVQNSSRALGVIELVDFLEYLWNFRNALIVHSSVSKHTILIDDDNSPPALPTINVIDSIRLSHRTFWMKIRQYRIGNIAQ